MGRTEDDATDARLLQEGRLEEVLARHLPALLARAHARIAAPPDAEDVVQKTLLRVVGEFHEGRTWGGAPIRVVLHKRLDWTIGDHFSARRDEVGLPDGWDPPDAADPYADLEDRDYVAGVLADLPPPGRTGRCSRGPTSPAASSGSPAPERPSTRGPSAQSTSPGAGARACC